MSLPAGGQPSRENNAPRGLGPPAGRCRQTEPDRTEQLALAPFQPGTLSLALPSQVHCLVVPGRQACFRGPICQFVSKRRVPTLASEIPLVGTHPMDVFFRKAEGVIRTFFFTTSKQREYNRKAEWGTAAWGRGGRAGWTKCGAKHETHS